MVIHKYLFRRVEDIKILIALVILGWTILPALAGQVMTANEYSSLDKLLCEVDTVVVGTVRQGQIVKPAGKMGEPRVPGQVMWSTDGLPTPYSAELLLDVEETLKGRKSTTLTLVAFLYEHYLPSTALITPKTRLLLCIKNGRIFNGAFRGPHGGHVSKVITNLQDPALDILRRGSLGDEQKERKVEKIVVPPLSQPETRDQLQFAWDIFREYFEEDLTKLAADIPGIKSLKLKHFYKSAIGGGAISVKYEAEDPVKKEAVLQLLEAALVQRWYVRKINRDSLWGIGKKPISEEEQKEASLSSLIVGFKRGAVEP